MMNLVLKTIALQQFKGMNDQVFQLTDLNHFMGDNRTGKTTIANGIVWCLFGKDVYGRSDYEIMPLDINGKMIDKQEPSVTLVFEIDGSKKTFKRVMSQKWIKKRGDAESSFDGSCTTSYFVDDVPVMKKDFQNIVNSIVDESLFRVITLPANFPSLDMKVRRQMIIDIVGDVDMAGIQSRAEFANLVAHMEGKDLEDYRKMIAFQKKGIKKDIDAIPGKIKAAQEFIPEEEPDYAALQSDVNAKKAEIKVIDVKIADKSSVLDDFHIQMQDRMKKIQELEASKNTFITNFIADKQTELDGINAEKRQNLQDINAKKSDIQDQEMNIKAAENAITRLENELKQLADQRAGNKTEWQTLNAKVFVAPADNKCMSCGQMIVKTQEEIAKLEETFNNNKANGLQAILDRNAPLMTKCTEIEETNLPAKQKDLAALKADLSTLKDELKALEELSSTFISRIAAVNITAAKVAATQDAGYIEIENKITELKDMKSEAPKVDITEFNAQKTILTSEIEELQKQINRKETVDQARANIDKYTKEGKTLADRLAELEGYEYSAELFEKAIAEDVEARINTRLSGGVSFKMFHKQNNEGIKPICDILVDGVPYNSANTASQIQAGIAIINLLSDHYDIHAPIIVDNRESVIEIPDTPSQIINLIVNKEYKSLTLLN